MPKEQSKKKGKKEMKKTTEKKVVNFAPTRKMFNSILTKNKGLTLVENKHGAIQVKREGSLLFSARKDGKMIISHPMTEGKGAKKARVFKIAGTKWDHLSQVPFDKVTLKMLEDRVKDKKTAAEYHAEFYGGKNKEKSGLYQKALAAEKRTSKVKKEVKGTKRIKVKTKVKAKVIKTPKGKSAKAIARVAAKAKA